MKYLSIVFILFSLAVQPAHAQKKCLKKFYREYRGEAFRFKVGVGSVPIRLASWIIPASVMKEEGVPLKELLSKVQRVKVYTISVDEGIPVETAAIQRLKQTLINNEKFEQLVEVRNGTSIVHLLNKGKDDELGKVVLLVQDEHEFVMVNLHTRLQMKDVNSLIQQFAGI